jgi:adenylate cyclase class 2
MIEVEVKARAQKDTADKIVGLGAVLLGTENHRDLYFNSPLRDFKVSDEALRIRIKEDGARLTYKGPKLDRKTKSRKELTVKIDSHQEMEAILSSLGFFLSAEVCKCRTKYSYGDVIIALDEVEGLGSFLELEVRGGVDWGVQAKKVLDLLKILDLGESIRSSYLELLAEKLQENAGT